MSDNYKENWNCRKRVHCTSTSPDTDSSYDDKYAVSDLGFNHCTIMPPVESN